MTITSDTLFSALFIEALQLGIETDWLLNDLIISDTFPYENEIYYLPKPLIKIESKEEGNHKAFKKLKYVPVHHYNQYLNGELSAEDATDLNDIFSIGHFLYKQRFHYQHKKLIQVLTVNLIQWEHLLLNLKLVYILLQNDQKKPLTN